VSLPQLVELDRTVGARNPDRRRGVEIATPHDQRGQSGRPSVEIVTFEATDVLSRLARAPGFALNLLHVSIVRRGFAGIVRAEFVPPDPGPLRIGAIELLQS
jgi:hypothetical protein